MWPTIWHVSVWTFCTILVRWHLGGVSWSRLFSDSRYGLSGLRVSIGALVCVWYVVWSCPVACPGPIAYSYLRETPPQHLPFSNTKVTAVMKVGRPAEQS
jgi:hypothetical protein